MADGAEDLRRVIELTRGVGRGELSEVEERRLAEVGGLRGEGEGGGGGKCDEDFDRLILGGIAAEDLMRIGESVVEVDGEYGRLRRRIRVGDLDFGPLSGLKRVVRRLLGRIRSAEHALDRMEDRD